MPHYIKPLIAIIIVLFFALSVSAQTELSTRSKKAIKLYYKGKTVLQNYRDMSNALIYFQQAIAVDSNFAEAHYEAARCYYGKADLQRGIAPELDKAVYHYERFVAIKPSSPQTANIQSLLGTYYLNTGDYAKAETKFTNLLMLPGISPNAQEEIRLKLECCRFAREQMAKAYPFNPRPMPAVINKYISNYFPTITADGKTMVYVVRDMNPPAGPGMDENLYVSYFKDSLWSDPVSISEHINSPMNEGTASISGDGRTLVFAICGKSDGLGDCDIYISYKSGKTWSVPVNMGAPINTRYWESQPTLTGDGRTIYFVSNRSGGMGGQDIYYSFRQEDGKWSQPKNMGPYINTKDDEVGPFVLPGGKTLYYSTKGLIGMGGYDLYMCERNDTGWSAPRNLGYPINTWANETSLIISPDGKHGYYTHYENERINNLLRSLIYVFDVPDEIKPTFTSSYLQGTVRDAVTGKVLEAQIQLYDLATGKTVQITQSDIETGRYLIVLTSGSQYALYVNKKGYLFKSLSFNYEKIHADSSLTIDILLSPLISGSAVVLNNIFFETAKYDLLERSKTELNVLVSFMKANPEIKVEISGHTDDVGNHDDNMTLSLNRAKAVYIYLQRSGIDVSRLTYKGYGETRPAVPNTSDENRALNRRIEFKIL